MLLATWVPAGPGAAGYLGACYRQIELLAGPGADLQGMLVKDARSLISLLSPPSSVFFLCRAMTVKEPGAPGQCELQVEGPMTVTEPPVKLGGTAP